MTRGIADKIAITTIVIAKNLPSLPRLCPLQGQSIALGCACRITPIIGKELASPTSVGLGLEDEVDGLSFAATNGHFLGLVPVGFLPCGDRVLARRQIRQRKHSAVA